MAASESKGLLVWIKNNLEGLQRLLPMELAASSSERGREFFPPMLAAVGLPSKLGYRGPLLFANHDDSPVDGAACEAGSADLSASATAS